MEDGGGGGQRPRPRRGEVAEVPATRADHRHRAAPQLPPAARAPAATEQIFLRAANKYFVKTDYETNGSFYSTNFYTLA